MQPYLVYGVLLVTLVDFLLLLECFCCSLPGVLGNTAKDSVMSINATVRAHSSRAICGGLHEHKQSLKALWGRLKDCLGKTSWGHNSGLLVPIHLERATANGETRPTSGVTSSLTQSGTGFRIYRVDTALLWSSQKYPLIPRFHCIVRLGSTCSEPFFFWFSIVDSTWYFFEYHLGRGSKRAEPILKGDVKNMADPWLFRESSHH